MHKKLVESTVNAKFYEKRLVSSPLKDWTCLTCFVERSIFFLVVWQCSNKRKKEYSARFVSRTLIMGKWQGCAVHAEDSIKIRWKIHEFFKQLLRVTRLGVLPLNRKTKWQSIRWVGEKWQQMKKFWFYKSIIETVFIVWFLFLRKGAQRIFWKYCKFRILCKNVWYCLCKRIKYIQPVLWKFRYFYSKHGNAVVYIMAIDTQFSARKTVPVFD